jgi:hypothetical protein
MERDVRFKLKRKGFFIILIISGLFGIGAVVMLLWNALLPGIFQLPSIGYWQALGILILSRILFGGFAKPNRSPYNKPHFREKFMNMTQEEHADFKQKWKDRCSKYKNR